MFTDDQIRNLSSKPVWVLDVDDCMYTIDCGLHGDVIKPSIVSVYNSLALNDPKKDIIVSRVREIAFNQGAVIHNPSLITPDDLGVAFPIIVKVIKEAYPQEVGHYLNRFYGDEYDRIAPNPNLLEAFKIAKDKGIEIFFYTNGPSGKKHGEELHLQKVMRHLGFDDSQIEAMRPKTYDLLMSIEAGRGKPTTEGMQDFIMFSGIDPKKAFMADDGPKNLVPARNAGMAALWTWTTIVKEPKDSDVELAAKLGAPRVHDTGLALLQIARAFRP